MKTFNLEKAKAGKLVCDEMNNDVRIICYNRQDKETPTYPIVALHLHNSKEYINTHLIDGKADSQGSSPYDLFMKTQKKEGWINLYKKHNGTLETSVITYPSKDVAFRNRNTIDNCIDTIKIEWEE